jgi:hypothetical protein
MAGLGWLRKTAGIWGPGLFAAASVTAARRQPGYSPRRDHISGLAAHGTRSAPVMLTGFAALGSAGLVMEADDAVVRRLVRIAGVATLVAGAARCTTPDCPTPFVDGEVGISDTTHAVASMVAFTGWTALPVLGALRPGPTWYRRSCAPVALATAAGYCTAGITTRRRSDRRGTAQRAFLAPVFLWYALTALRTLRRPAPASMSSRLA